MKEIGKIINKENFVSSFLILKEYLRRGIVYDTNLLLISEYLLSLSETQVKKYYERYVETGLLYSVPEFFSSDPVMVPKGIAGVREYRFFSTFSIILYNSLGIFFSEMCGDIKDALKLEKRNIFSYTPTKYIKESFAGDWKVNNEWNVEYSKFKKKLEEYSVEGAVILNLDIAAFFNTIDHRKLVQVIEEFSIEEYRQKYNYSQNSEDVLIYYLSSVMKDDKGLPQGKKNFASDYLAYLYLLRFDMAIQELSRSTSLSFVACVRYVDDIYIFFKNENGYSRDLVYKELSRIEHLISKWLYEELGLSLNSGKTERKILLDSKATKQFIEENSKKISSSNKQVKLKVVENKVREFFQALRRFKYPDNPRFTESFFGILDKERLKNVFEVSVKNLLRRKDFAQELKGILENVEFELAATNLDILITLFYISNNGRQLYTKKIENYLIKNFNPSDKRHIHIALMIRNVLKNEDFLKRIVKTYRNELLKDDYGKYLVLQYFPFENTKVKKELLISQNRVYARISQEKNKNVKNYPFIKKTDNHPFLSIVLSAKISEKGMDSIFSALSGYIHECYLGRWSLAFNKLQIIVHESSKAFFGIKDTEKVHEIIASLNKAGVNISTYEERDFLKFWHRRNFNPASHGSKNGLTAPEVTKKELARWEDKISELLYKMYI